VRHLARSQRGLLERQVRRRLAAGGQEPARGPHRGGARREEAPPTRRRRRGNAGAESNLRRARVSVALADAVRAAPRGVCREARRRRVPRLCQERRLQRVRESNPARPVAVAREPKRRARVRGGGFKRRGCARAAVRGGVRVEAVREPRRGGPPTHTAALGGPRAEVSPEPVRRVRRADPRLERVVPNTTRCRMRGVHVQGCDGRVARRGRRTSGLALRAQEQLRVRLRDHLQGVLEPHRSPQAAPAARGARSEQAREKRRTVMVSTVFSEKPARATRIDGAPSLRDVGDARKKMHK
jgi:hypothetical protein